MAGTKPIAVFVGDKGKKKEIYFYFIYNTMCRSRFMNSLAKRYEFPLSNQSSKVIYFKGLRWWLCDWSCLHKRK